MSEQGKQPQKPQKEQVQKPPIKKPAKQQQPQEQKHKEMRRVAKREEMPTDKSQLIQYLSSRIKQAEEALGDTEELLESEVTDREKIAKSIKLRNEQLQKWYQIDQRGLPEKIKEKLTEILTQTVEQKMEAEQALAEAKGRNYEFKRRYEELKGEGKIITSKLEEQTVKENSLNQELEQLDSSNNQHQSQLKTLETEFDTTKNQKQSLEDKYLQMKVALERMTDVRAVLNRFFGNQDLFDDKMELKEQKVQRVQVNPRETQHSRMPSRESAKNPRLKPLVQAKNEDDDFWKGDLNGKKNAF